MEYKKPNIAVVSFPWKSNAPYKFLSDLLKILEPISDKILLIDGNTDRIKLTDKIKVKDIGIKIHYLKDIKPIFYSEALWIINCILAQIITSLELIKSRKNIDIVIFYMAYPYYLIPLITSKILRKKTIEVVTRSKPTSLITRIIGLQDPILYSLLDGISPESKGLIRDLGLYKYKKKILPEGARYIDFSRYNLKMNIFKRKNLIGFVGRIRKEKGVIEFIDAISYLAKETENVEFLIGGSGDMLNTVIEKCKEIERQHNIKIVITGFIKEEEFPIYLKELKLLVLPTQHAEGLPTIILEAMACGTPVLTRRIGAISDVVIDGQTGFIMENTSPQCIADNMKKVLEYLQLNNIVNNAHELIKKKYSFEAAVERYRCIINQ